MTNRHQRYNGIPIYFNFSARSTEEVGATCRKMFDYLQEIGFKHVYTPNHLLGSEDFYDKSLNHKRLISDALIAASKSKIIILEVSTPSLTQGFLVAKALSEHRPVVCLHVREANPLFLKEFESELLFVEEYSLSNYKDVLVDTLSLAHATLPSRYNIMLPQDINNYLQWVAQHKQQTKSEFIRELIRSHMSTNQIYAL